MNGVDRREDVWMLELLSYLYRSSVRSVSIRRYPYTHTHTTQSWSYWVACQSYVLVTLALTWGRGNDDLMLMHHVELQGPCSELVRHAHGHIKINLKSWSPHQRFRCECRRRGFSPGPYDRIFWYHVSLFTGILKLLSCRPLV